MLASADLIDRLELPPEIAKRSLGDLRLRGKENDLALYALTTAPPRARGSSAEGGEIAREERPAAFFLTGILEGFGENESPRQG